MNGDTRDETDDGNEIGGDPRLEAAWGALEEGDIAGAREQAAKLDAGSPDVMLLLAACSREDGDVGGAKAILAKAAAADPDWSTPELWLAELESGEAAGEDDDGELLERALRHARRAVDLAEEEAEFVSAIALKAELEARLGKEDAARATLAELPPPDVELGDVDAALEIADLHLALGQAEVARDRLRVLTASNPESADAWYALGCAAADLDDLADMRQSWKRAWTLDSAPGGARRPDPISEDEIAAVAETALGELPPRAQELLRGVPIVIADRPAEADVDEGLDPRALGVFSGTAYPDVSTLGGQPGLTQIVLFRRCIERIALGADQLRQEVRATLLHETGHFFGLDEAELGEVGLE
jgi:predicted Zn-dependent protease with MMP-like domain